MLAQVLPANIQTFQNLKSAVLQKTSLSANSQCAPQVPTLSNDYITGSPSGWQEQYPRGSLTEQFHNFPLLLTLGYSSQGSAGSCTCTCSI